MMAEETEAEDESGPSSLVASYGGNGDGDQPSASVSLVPAKTYVSASAKAAADGPNNPVDSTKSSGPKTALQHDRWTTVYRYTIVAMPHTRIVRSCIITPLRGLGGLFV